MRIYITVDRVPEDRTRDPYPGARCTTGSKARASAARGPRPWIGAFDCAPPLLDTAQGFDPYTANFMETFIRFLATVRRSFIRTHKRNATRLMMACMHLSLDTT